MLNWQIDSVARRPKTANGSGLGNCLDPWLAMESNWAPGVDTIGIREVSFYAVSNDNLCWQRMVARRRPNLLMERGGSLDCV